MADSGGHWKNLAEARRLTQSELIPGVVDESPKRGGQLPMLPVRQSTGTSLQWNRSLERRTATRIAVGDELVWSDNITYDPQEVFLKIFYDQSPLNKFVQQVYGTIQNYEAQKLLEQRVGIIETLEDALIYDNVTFNTLQINGLHHWAALNTGNLNIDEGEGPLSFANVRKVISAMRYGVSYILMSFQLRDQISAFYQEAGSSAPSQLGQFVWTIDAAGMPVAMWGGIPIIASDYMVAEEKNTGAGSDARAKNTTGTEQFSILFVKMGRPTFDTADPGVIYIFGGDTHSAGEVYRTEFFPTLEDFDASGLRLVNYSNIIAGSTMSVGRIFDITDTPPTA